MSASIMIFTKVFGLEALSLYKTEKRSSSIAGNISSEKICDHEFTVKYVTVQNHEQLRLSHENSPSAKGLEQSKYYSIFCYLTEMDCSSIIKLMV